MPERDPTEPRIVELAPQATVAVRVRQPMAELDLAALFARYIPTVFESAASLGETLSAPPYGRFHEFGPDQVDVEIGAGVAAPVSGLQPLAECEPGEVGSSELPGGPAVTATHLGQYDTLSQMYDRIHEWMHEHGRSEGPGPWESYVDNPDEVEDLSRLRTEIFWPLA